MSQEPPLTPALRDLRDLFKAGGWRQLASLAGLQMFLRSYPDGSVDVLTLRGETDAEVERTNPAGDPVKSETGTLREMIALLREMPPPGSSDGPTFVVQTRRKPIDVDKPPWMQ